MAAAGAGVDPSAGSGDHLEFDAYGLPCGVAGERTWDVLLDELNAEADADGWDRPARLLGVLNPVLTEASLAVAGMELDTLLDHHRPGGHDGPASGFMLVPLGEFTSSPAEQLWCVDVPDAFGAVVLAVEAWSYPDGIDPAEQTVAPSQHPDRVELRSWLLVTRAGHVHHASYVRGLDGSSDRAPVDASAEVSFRGRLVSLLARTIGVDLPVDPHSVPMSVQQYLGCVLGAGVVASFRGPVDGMDAVERVWRMGFGERHPALDDDVPPVECAWQSTPCPPSAERVSAALLASLMIAARLGWAASGAGRRIPDGPAKDAIHAMARGGLPPLGPEDAADAGAVADVLDALRRGTAGVSWMDLVLHGDAAEMLPRAFPPSPAAAAWLGEPAMRDWVGAQTSCPPDAAQAALASLDEVTGVRFIVDDVLAVLGWRLPAAGSADGVEPPGQGS